MFDTSIHFYPSSIFAWKAKSLPFDLNPVWGSSLVGIAVANKLAYYNVATITPVKGFKVQVQGPGLIFAN